MSAAIGLSHNMFDGALYLGVCDKIVPGLTMAALSFGHLPSVFIPSGPMAMACRIKRRFAFASWGAEGKLTVWRPESEAASYHAPGTRTFTERRTPTRWWVGRIGGHMQLPARPVHPDVCCGKR
ncbi:dihydroxy-acid dehydratase [Klebsiella pneumoniae]|nr:dihydroxy-acid dehydratase [Klebsiella pneumoniae]